MASTREDVARRARLLEDVDGVLLTVLENTEAREDDPAKVRLVSLSSRLSTHDGDVEWSVWRDATPDAVRRVLSTKATMMGGMLLDSKRNEAYERAIRDAVALKLSSSTSADRTIRVLDVGSGTGLLSVYAARADERVRVTGLEMNHALAQTSEAVMKELGLSDRVRILPMHSSELSCSPQEPPFDIVVSETMDSFLTTEGARDALRDVKERLTSPDAIVIPSSGDIHGYLVQVHHDLLAGDARTLAWRDSGAPECGPRRDDDDCAEVPREAWMTNLVVRSKDVIRMSESAELFACRFDGLEKTVDETRVVDFAVPAGGRVHGLATYWRARLHGDVSLDTNPASNYFQDHWHHAVFELPRVLTVESGEVVRVTFTVLADSGQGVVAAAEVIGARRRSKRARRAEPSIDPSLDLAAHYGRSVRSRFASQIKALSEELDRVLDVYTKDAQGSSAQLLLMDLALNGPFCAFHAVGRSWGARADLRVVGRTPKSPALAAAWSAMDARRLPRLRSTWTDILNEAKLHSALMQTQPRASDTELHLVAATAPCFDGEYETDAVLSFAYRCAALDPPPKRAVPSGARIVCELIQFSELRSPGDAPATLPGHASVESVWDDESRRRLIDLEDYAHVVAAVGNTYGLVVDFAGSELRASQNVTLSYDSEKTLGGNVDDKNGLAVAVYVEWMGGESNDRLLDFRQDGKRRRELYFLSKASRRRLTKEVKLGFGVDPETNRLALSFECC